MFNIKNKINLTIYIKNDNSKNIKINFFIKKF